MNPNTKNILRNIAAVLLGIIVGSAINMAIVMQTQFPDGVTFETLSDNWDKVSLSFFVLPFLGHAIGTLVGAIVAALISPNHKFKMAMVIGVWFLIGGIINELMIKSPVWYTIVDLLFAYIPMGFLGYQLSKLFQRN